MMSATQLPHEQDREGQLPSCIESILRQVSAFVSAVAAQGPRTEEETYIPSFPVHETQIPAC